MRQVLPLAAHGKAIMANDAVQNSRDWLRSPRIRLLAWWLPKAALVLGLFVPVPFRAAIWTVALLWMGTACIANARRCGRTHCRYTGPYYLAMIVPVLILALVLGQPISTHGSPWEGLFSAEAKSFGGPPSGRGANFLDRSYSPEQSGRRLQTRQA